MKEKPEIAEAATPEQTPLEALVERVAALEAQAHNTHSIAPEVIELIVRQAVQQVAAHLRKTGDILDVLGK